MSDYESDYDDEDEEYGVRECLQTLDITDAKAFFDDCSTLEEEFKLIKKKYFKKVLVCHPDKGGDAAEFRDVQSAFEILRSLFEQRSVPTFVAGDDDDEYTDVQPEKKRSHFSRRPKPTTTPSWQYYYEASEEAVPTYRVEPAKSGRSQCKAKGAANHHGQQPFINKGDIRIGSIDVEAGAYSRWIHLHCWRVPYKVWMGLPDPETCTDEARFEAALLAMNEVLLCGINELSQEQRADVVRYTMVKSNWARARASSAPAAATSEVVVGSSSSSSSSSSAETPSKPAPAPAPSPQPSAAASPSSSALASAPTHSPTPTKPSSQPTTAAAAATAIARAPSAGAGAGGRFIVPVPGRDGAIPQSLAGKVVVLTGLFPELGGGAGLDLGKARAKALVESFGGKVTSAVSGRTNVLLVGRDPGFSKVSKARAQKGKTQLMGLRDLVDDCIFGGALLTDGSASSSTALINTNKEFVITSFSAGYRGNGQAMAASDASYAIASGLKKAPDASVQQYRAPPPPKPPKEKKVKVLKIKAPKPPKPPKAPKAPKEPKAPKVKVPKEPKAPKAKASKATTTAVVESKPEAATAAAVTGTAAKKQTAAEKRKAAAVTAAAGGASVGARKRVKKEIVDM